MKTMKLNRFYFAEKGQPGLTMDKAQRLCVWADKMMMKAKAATSSINFVNEKEISPNNVEVVTVIGDTQISFDQEIKDMIALTSLMSWLHEAIHAKKSLGLEARERSIENWAKLNDIELPKYPEDPDRHTDETVMSEWAPEKVARFYRLENTCAVLHKLVGKGAPYENAIEQLLETAKSPREKSWHGDKLYVTEFTPSVDTDEAIRQFNAYQQQHSQAQSELNAMKDELEQEVRHRNVLSRASYTEALAIYNEKMAIMCEKFKASREQEMEEVSKLRIRIPENLMDIFNAVRSMGKEPIDAN